MSNAKVIRAIIDKGELWQDYVDADGYNVTADHVAAEIAALMAGSAEVFTIGDETHKRVFQASGLTNVHDLQKVLDAVEVALVAAGQNVAAQPVEGKRTNTGWLVSDIPAIYAVAVFQIVKNINAARLSHDESAAAFAFLEGTLGGAVQAVPLAASPEAQGRGDAFAAALLGAMRGVGIGL